MDLIRNMLLELDRLTMSQSKAQSSDRQSSRMAASGLLPQRPSSLRRPVPVTTTEKAASDADKRPLATNKENKNCLTYP